MSEDIREGFRARLHEICDDMRVPRERGRQTALAKIFKVTPNGARKWLNGLGLPELEQAIALSNWAGVNVSWLLQGAGPKHGSRISAKALVLDEAIHDLPAADGRQVLDFIRYKIERADGPIAGERLARYKVMIEAFESDVARKARPSPEHEH